jgi:hypothetical protein
MKMASFKMFLRNMKSKISHFECQALIFAPLFLIVFPCFERTSIEKPLFVTFFSTFNEARRNFKIAIRLFCVFLEFLE